MDTASTTRLKAPIFYARNQKTFPLEWLSSVTKAPLLHLKGGHNEVTSCFQERSSPVDKRHAVNFET